MSARYFRHTSGMVSSSEALADINGWTEVQVVPIDAVVLDGPLPGVEHDVDGTFARVTFRQGTFGPPVRMPSNPTEHTADAIYAQGLARLALAAYLRERPPIDEHELDRLSDSIYAAAHWTGSLNEAYDLARDLLRNGRTKGGAA